MITCLVTRIPNGRHIRPVRRVWRGRQNLHEIETSGNALVSSKGSKCLVNSGGPKTLWPEFSARSYIYDYAKHRKDGPRIPQAEGVSSLSVGRTTLATVREVDGLVRPEGTASRGNPEREISGHVLPSRRFGELAFVSGGFSTSVICFGQSLSDRSSNRRVVAGRPDRDYRERKEKLLPARLELAIFGSLLESRLHMRPTLYRLSQGSFMRRSLNGHLGDHAEFSSHKNKS
ncbi:hypothetical protein H4582DRAFT_2200890 [Lactarius indigo]|nr:hypothetical protein H4582DRAFT_2200890 [Lactarius indigo]